MSNFKDFWVADAAPVIVDGAPPGSRVTLETGHGVVAATTDTSGQASLAVPAPELVGTGVLSIRGPAGVRTFRHLHYAGGDTLQITN